MLSADEMFPKYVSKINITDFTLVLVLFQLELSVVPCLRPSKKLKVKSIPKDSLPNKSFTK